MTGLRAMTIKGMQLVKDTTPLGWQVTGPGHNDYGGFWEYPHHDANGAQGGSPMSPSPAILTFDLGRASSFGSFAQLMESAGLEGDEDLLLQSLEEGAEVGVGGSAALNDDAQLLPSLDTDRAQQGVAVLQLGAGRASGLPGQEGGLPGGCESSWYQQGSDCYPTFVSACSDSLCCCSPGVQLPVYTSTHCDRTTPSSAERGSGGGEAGVGGKYDEVGADDEHEEGSNTLEGPAPDKRCVEGDEEDSTCTEFCCLQEHLQLAIKRYAIEKCVHLQH